MREAHASYSELEIEGDIVEDDFVGGGPVFGKKIDLIGYQRLLDFGSVLPVETWMLALRFTECGRDEYRITEISHSIGRIGG
jgi:hypothetical protein